MKKFIKTILFFTMILLVACTSTPDTSDESHETTQQEDEIKEENHEMEVNKEESNFKTESESQYEINDNWSITPIEEDMNEKVVLLTIDDAPDKYGLEMAKTLKELDAHAVFFVNGHFLSTPEKQEELKKIHDMGFVIGNHTFNHAYLPELSKEEQKEEIVELNDLIEEIIGERPTFFRAPNGANTDYTKQLAEDENMLLMNWSYGYDWEPEYQSKEAITEIMLETDLLSNE